MEETGSISRLPTNSRILYACKGREGGKFQQM
jgi:hypothetical protein